ncbi:hypothetical protein [Sphingomonas leidyi]|uniref:hypothetical protein n=1 Tax=Sphingomonas leidyi TaxID=68569 RepID=UPI003BADB99C
MILLSFEFPCVSETERFRRTRIYPSKKLPPLPVFLGYSCEASIYGKILASVRRISDGYRQNYVHNLGASVRLLRRARDAGPLEKLPMFCFSSGMALPFENHRARRPSLGRAATGWLRIGMRNQAVECRLGECTRLDRPAWRFASAAAIRVRQ